MRLLIDSCVGSRTRDALVQAGHDVVWARDWPADPGDTVILRTAVNDRRTVVTIDKDFGDLVTLGKIAHFGIVRLVDLSVRTAPARCVEALAAHEADLLGGAIVVVEPGRTRVRRSD